MKSKNFASFLKNLTTFSLSCGLTIFLIVLALNSFSQARGGVGIRYGINKPLSNKYDFGTSVALQINAAFNKKWGFELSAGNDRIDVDRNIAYLPAGTPDYIRPQSLNLYHLDLAARRYLIPNLFVKAGLILFVAGGNEDLAGLGLGGTVALGYQVMMDERNKLEFTINTDILEAHKGLGIIPITGLKIGYAINFSKLPQL